MNAQRLATGNMVGGRARNGAKLAPLAPNMINSRDQLKSGGAKTSAGRARRGPPDSLVQSV